MNGATARETDERGYDVECVALVDAMNEVNGIATIESCCGHGETPFRIWFVADSLAALPPLLYWFDACHSGVRGWKVIATTDCAASPVKFIAESESMGPDAYLEANEIAAAIRGELTDRSITTPLRGRAKRNYLRRQEQGCK